MIRYIKRFMGVATLGACVLGISCGGGSQPPQTPFQPPETASVQTGSHVLGDANARVTIIEFCDFQCPYCKAFYMNTGPQIIESYVNTGKVKLAFRQFPLSSIHQNALPAAQASECAAKLGGNDGFWKYHAALFTNGTGDGTGLDVASLRQYAADLQFDTDSFSACVDNQETAGSVSKDLTDGRAAGVSGTPTFFINGKKFEGAQTFSNFKTAIEAEL